MRHLNPITWMLALVAMLLAGCAQLGLEKPQSVQDRLQYGKATVTASYKTVGDLVAVKAISAVEGAAYFMKIEDTERQLVLAEQLLAGGRPTDALSKITLTLNALTVLRNELAARAQQKGT